MRSPRFPVLHGLAAILVAAAALTACSRQAPPAAGTDTEDDQVVPVAAQPVEVGTLRAVIHASGSVVPADGAEFLAIAPESARVVEITRNQGEPVAAGDVLVRFELPSAAQELARRQAEMAGAEAQLENVRATRARVADFVERGLVPRNDLNQADRELGDAQAAATAAAGALERARDTMARATVRAPFSGIVTNRLHEPGDLVQASPNDPVLRVVDPTRLEVQASIPGADASRVLPGSPARVAGSVEGQTIGLRVERRPAGTPDGAGHLRARLTFTSPSTLTVDSPVELDIDAEERLNVVFVSHEAIVGGDKDAAVFVAVGDVATRRAVTTGVTTELGVEITSGLRAGELVITRGQASVTDGQRISVEVTR